MTLISHCNADLHKALVKLTVLLANSVMQVALFGSSNWLDHCVQLTAAVLWPLNIGRVRVCEGSFYFGLTLQRSPGCR